MSKDIFLKKLSHFVLCIWRTSALALILSRGITRVSLELVMKQVTQSSTNQDDFLEEKLRIVYYLKKRETWHTCIFCNRLKDLKIFLMSTPDYFRVIVVWRKIS